MLGTGIEENLTGFFRGICPHNRKERSHMNADVMLSVEVHGHEVNGLNDHLAILADGPGSGNASHNYEIIWNQHTGATEGCVVTGKQCEITFQNGPISENGVNGVSNEALLAIVRHRLQGFQSGQFSCRENAIALTKIEEALHWLLSRTRERAARGVEGTMAL
jgi:hypothetical protein